MKRLVLIIMMSLSIFALGGDLENILVKDLKGNVFTMKKFEGKKTYIKVWASWCPACLYSLPHAVELAKNEKDFSVVSLVMPDSRGEQNEEDFKKWFKSTEFNGKLEVLMDGQAAILKKVNIRAYPYNIFLDSKGNIATTKLGVLSNQQIKDIMKNIK